ncbi:MAG: hypothetical protein AAGJ18_28870, partial [Bacteroidota bacterium]
TALRASELQTSNLLSLVDDTANNLIDNGAIERNATIWGNEDYTSSVNNLKNYLENRAAWMDSEIGSF